MKNKNITFGTYMLDWYMIYKYPKHAITTRNVCLTYINVHIRPSNIGKKYIRNITTMDLVFSAIKEYESEKLNKAR